METEPRSKFTDALSIAKRWLLGAIVIVGLFVIVSVVSAISTTAGAISALVLSAIGGVGVFRPISYLWVKNRTAAVSLLIVFVPVGLALGLAGPSPPKGGSEPTVHDAANQQAQSDQSPRDGVHVENSTTPVPPSELSELIEAIEAKDWISASTVWEQIRDRGHNVSDVATQIEERALVQVAQIPRLDPASRLGGYTFLSMLVPANGEYAKRVERYTRAVAKAEEERLLAERRRRLQEERAREIDERRAAAAAKRERECGENRAIDAYIWSKTFVRPKLKAPSTASFPWSGKSNALGDCMFRVVAYVDAENGFGAQIRTYYEAKMKFDPASDQWTLVDLRFED